MRRPVHGFTLIELVVAITILGLALAAVMPDVSAWLRNQRIRNMAESMQSGLQRARAEAVRRNVPVTFWLVNLTDAQTLNNDCTVSATGTSWVVSLDAPAGKCGSAPSATDDPRLVVAHNAGGGSPVTVAGTRTDLSTSASQVTFDGFGRIATASVGTDLHAIAIAYPTGSRRTDDRGLRIEVTPGGQIRLCDPAVSGTDARRCDYTVPTAGGSSGSPSP